MKFGMYSIRDQLVGYLTPSYAANDDVAIRNFSILINDDKGTMLSAQPQYFDLYKVGFFDDDSGILEALNPVELIVTGLSVKKGENDGVQK